MHPADMIFYWAKADPERLAIIQLDTLVSYRALAAAVETIGEYLNQHDLRPEKAVGVAIDSPAKQLAVCLALLRRGIPAAPIHETDVSNLLRNEIDTVIFDHPAAMLRGGRNIRFEDAWLRSPSDEPLRTDYSSASRAADTHLVFFTSGTTGTPKKSLTPAAALLDRMSLLPITGETNFKRILILAGLNSAFGFTRALIRLGVGVAVCFAGPAKAKLRLINTYNVEGLIGSPQQVLELAEATKKDTQFRSESLKDVRIGGGFASPALVRQVQADLAHDVTTEYGSTETGMIAFAKYQTIADVPNGVGFLIPDAQVQIVDEFERLLPPGEPGLVRCRTNYFMKVFAAHNPGREINGEVWWYTGDIGHITEAGVFCITGRRDDVINWGGAKLSADVLEEVVRRHPAVADAAVCAMRTASIVEEIWLAVVLRAVVDLKDLKKAIETDPDFRAVVSEVFVLESLPRNDMGKLQRNQVRDMMVLLKDEQTS
jgi:acyl-coenzyme A synthetase/AMP-(fatty) acid ligase